MSPPKVRPIQEQLPLDLIRRHVKIEDYQGVGDDQLELLRDAAIEAFESYTGRVVGARRLMRHPVKVPRWTSVTQAARARVMCALRHPAVDGVVTLEYGGKLQIINVIPGKMQFEWPITFPRPMDNWTFPFPLPALQNQCDSCGQAQSPELPHVSYQTGGEELAPGAKIGCLSMIAWMYEHPGDELATIGDRYARVSATGQQGTNNAIVGSGAYAHWHRYKGRIAR